MTEIPFYVAEGKSYLRTVTRSLDSPKFNPLILYNILSMAIEKMFMAFIMSRGQLPENHTLNDLLFYVLGLEDLDEEIQSGIKEMDSYQELCSTDKYTRKEIQQSDVLRFLELTKKISDWVDSQLSTTAHVS